MLKVYRPQSTMTLAANSVVVELNLSHLGARKTVERSSKTKFLTQFGIMILQIDFDRY